MSLRDLFKPFTAWKNLLAEPVPIKKPLERQGAPRYRGFHKNDLEKCIGCGTCEEICQNAAIDMVPVEGEKTEEGDSGLRPRIDYGRCCWCALCVDICTTGSLTMSNQFQWVDSDPEAFRFVPGAGEKHWDDEELGYKKPNNYELNNLDRIDMDEMEPEERNHTFLEIVKGFSKEQAMQEADRCVECGICIATCPAHMGIPSYIKAIREDDVEEGLRIMYETNPLPEVCGRVCTHKCETVCAMQHRGEPISIRWLKRYIADQVSLDKYQEIMGPDNLEKREEKVAIIGAGPAGLSASYYLAMMGYNVKIFEALEKPGGMTRYGIPEYRLPYEELDKDVEYIKSLGVEFQFNTKVGENITLDEIHNDFDAVFAGTGLHMGRSTKIPGADHEKCYQAVELLRKFTQGKEIEVAEKIVVIGGGNVAMDISRTLARLQNKQYGQVQLITTSLESEDIMPADEEEIIESREEGITLKPGWGPKEIKIEDEEVKGLKVVKCLSVFDDEGRFNPKFDQSEKDFFAGDMVVEAIGQGMDISYMEDVELTERHKVKVDQNYQSSKPWLFVGGDIVNGPDAISAIADGHKAAKGIDNYLSSKGEK